jgi:hypothetical protein
VTYGEFNGGDRTGAVTEALYDGSTQSQLVFWDQEVDVCEVSAANIRVNASKQIGYAFEGDRLDANPIQRQCNFGKLSKRNLVAFEIKGMDGGKELADFKWNTVVKALGV